MLGLTSPVLQWFYFQQYASVGVHYNNNDYIMFQHVLKLWNSCKLKLETSGNRLD
jgi:hypothetical protein